MNAYEEALKFISDLGPQSECRIYEFQNLQQAKAAADRVLNIHAELRSLIENRKATIGTVEFVDANLLVLGGLLSSEHIEAANRTIQELGGQLKAAAVSEAPQEAAICWYCGNRPASSEHSYSVFLQSRPVYRLGSPIEIHRIEIPIPRCSVCESSESRFGTISLIAALLAGIAGCAGTFLFTDSGKLAFVVGAALFVGTFYAARTLMFRKTGAKKEEEAERTHPLVKAKIVEGWGQWGIPAGMENMMQDLTMDVERIESKSERKTTGESFDHADWIPIPILSKGCVDIEPDWATSPAASSIVDLVEKALKHSDPGIRLIAVKTLAGIGSGNVRVKALLKKATQDSDQSVRGRAMGALASIENKIST